MDKIERIILIIIGMIGGIGISQIINDIQNHHRFEDEKYYTTMEIDSLLLQKTKDISVLQSELQYHDVLLLRLQSKKMVGKVKAKLDTYKNYWNRLENDTLWNTLRQKVKVIP